MNLVLVVVGTVVGNCLEWYDFACYSAFTKEISRNFFPATDDGVSELLGALGVYAAAFVMRPVGGLLLGYIGDKYGRTVSLRLSVVGMGTAAIVMAVLPSYAYAPGYSIGLPATILMFIVRMVQGLSVGGELVGSMIYSAETATPGRETLLACLPLASAMSGSAMGFLVAGILTAVLTEEQEMLYGWRIGFALGTPLTFLAVYVRSKLHESDTFIEAKANQEAKGGRERQSPVKEALTSHGLQVFLVFVATSLWCLGIWMAMAWLRVFYTTLVANPVEESRAHILNMSCIVLAALSFIPIAALADRLRDGTFRVMFSGGCFLCLAAPFLLTVISRGASDIVAVVLGQLVWMVSLAMFGAPMTRWMVGRFPTHVQYCALAIAYNLSQAVFAGPAEFVLTKIAVSSDLLVAPALYFSAVAVLALGALVVADKTYFGRPRVASPVRTPDLSWEPSAPGS